MHWGGGGHADRQDLGREGNRLGISLGNFFILFWGGKLPRSALALSLKNLLAVAV